jgi:hypothetical protein
MQPSRPSTPHITRIDSPAGSGWAAWPSKVTSSPTGVPAGGLRGCTCGWANQGRVGRTVSGGSVCNGQPLGCD